MRSGNQLGISRAVGAQGRAGAADHRRPRLTRLGAAAGGVVGGRCRRTILDKRHFPLFKDAKAAAFRVFAASGITS